MTAPRLVPLALSAALLLAATPAIDAGELRRGMAAVGERTSEQPALRAEAQAGASFRLGAVFQAWRNSAAAVRFDASTTTGDGGDAEALAIDCGDERLAFASLEAATRAIGAAEADVARLAGDPKIVAIWQARRSAAPKDCHG